MDDGDNGCVGGIKITSIGSKRFRSFRTIFFWFVPPSRSQCLTSIPSMIKNDGGLGVVFDRSDDIYTVEVTTVYNM